MKKQIIAAFFILASVFYAQSQVFTGGNVSFNYNNSGLYLDAAPEIGYRVKRVLSVGVSPVLSANYYYEPNDLKYNYGGKVFSRLEILNGAYATASAEAINIEFDSSRKWIFALPVGAGFRYKVGKISLYSELVYDVLLHPDSPRKNPIVRGGINYDF